MKTFLFGATVAAAAAAIGLAGVAHAAPTGAVNVPVSAGRGSVGVGIGFGTGGYYESAPSGYWTTQYRVVPTTVLVGYDQWRRPVYQTQYVQQPYQVWVPQTHYAPVVQYRRRPAVTFGVGFGYRWR